MLYVYQYTMQKPIKNLVLFGFYFDWSINETFI